MTSYRKALAWSQTSPKCRNMLVRIIGVTAAVFVWSASAHAQINPFRGYTGPVLSKADLEQSTEAVEGFSKTDEEKWEHRKHGPVLSSGNSGTLTVQSAFERKGSTCRSLRSVVNYKNGTKRTLTLNVCRQPNGDWKIV